MYSIYLVTGASGFLGRAVISELINQGAKVRALVMKEDKLQHLIPKEAEIVYGDITNKESLHSFVDVGDRRACVIHCAGIVSISSNPSELLQRVNVGGTRNIVELCAEYHISKLVYVSSVHAIPDKTKGEIIKEPSGFSPDSVRGAYAKSKAEATAFALKSINKDLNVSVVHPSGIIGPGDAGCGSITGMLISYCNGKLPIGVKGGYDFVDVRDVAKGIFLCCEKGKSGECYILSNRYVSIREILEKVRKMIGGKKIVFYAPLYVAKFISAMFERCSLKKNEPLNFTPYAVEVLGTKAVFSHKKAHLELGYVTRNFTETLEDTIRYLKKTNRISCAGRA